MAMKWLPSLPFCLFSACFIHASPQRARLGGPSGQGDSGFGARGHPQRMCHLQQHQGGGSWAVSPLLGPPVGQPTGVRGAETGREEPTRVAELRAAPPHPRTSLIQGHPLRKTSRLLPPQRELPRGRGLSPPPTPAAVGTGGGRRPAAGTEAGSVLRHAAARLGVVPGPGAPHPSGFRGHCQAVPTLLSRKGWA